jgi:hypothetical protein
MALVVHDDDDKSSLPRATESIVLDALPYVENLDPDYEQYAMSLIEDELQQQHLGGGEAEHPMLRRLIPLATSSSREYTDLASTAPDFGGKAPIAASAYKSLMERQAQAEESGVAAPPVFREWSLRPDPIAENGGSIQGEDKERNIPDLQTSIATSKIKLEQERLRLVNLELHQQFETRQRYTAYHNQLESQYLTPMTQALESQRMKVDGINATRMEEQEVAMRKLEGLTRKWDSLVDKNRRLVRAIGGLEGEVEDLKQSAGDGVLEGGAMDVAEVSKET